MMAAHAAVSERAPKQLAVVLWRSGGAARAPGGLGRCWGVRVPPMPAAK